jgi:hypothetical protein
MLLETIFFSSLKGKKFRTRDGSILELVDFDNCGVDALSVYMRDQNGKQRRYDANCNGKIYRTGIECPDDIVEEVRG